MTKTPLKRPSVPIGLLQYDKDFKVTDANASLASLFGVEPAPVRGKSINEALEMLGFDPEILEKITNLSTEQDFDWEGTTTDGAKDSGITGKLELAQGGTLLLDEIGEMPVGLQSKLPRTFLLTFFDFGAGRGTGGFKIGAGAPSLWQLFLLLDSLEWWWGDLCSFKAASDQRRDCLVNFDPFSLNALRSLSRDVANCFL